MLHYLWTMPAIGVGTALEVVGGAMLNAGICLQAHGKTKNLEEDKKLDKADDNVECVKVALHAQRYHDTLKGYKVPEDKALEIAKIIASVK